MNEITLSDLEQTHKLCPKCQCYRFKSEFGSDKQRVDKLTRECKHCINLHVRNKYQLIINDPVLLEKRKEMIRSLPSERLRGYEKKYASLNPEKHKARQKVLNEIRSGRITRMPCEICESLESQAHHDDYSKPLDVRWLCEEHHKEHHRKYK